MDANQSVRCNCKNIAYEWEYPVTKMSHVIELLHHIQKAKLSVASNFVKEVHATCGKAKGSFGATKCWQKVPEYGPWHVNNFI